MLGYNFQEIPYRISVTDAWCIALLDGVISRILLGFLFGILSGKDREFSLEKMSVIHQIQLTCHAQLQIVDFEIIINKSNQLPQEIFQI